MKKALQLVPLRKLFAAAAMSMALIPFSAQALAPVCAEIFSLTAAEKTALFDLEDQQSSQLNDYLTDQLLVRSRALETQFQTKPPYVPVVVVGAGLHAAIFNLEAAKLGQSSSVLTIEAGSRVSKVFGDLAGSFRINSSERKGQSLNVFPGSPLEMQDLTQQTFPNSVHMGLMGSAAQRASHVPVLLENKVTSIEDTRLTHQKAPGRYIVKTSQGITVFTDKIVLSTGLGEPSTRIPDENFQKIMRASTEQHLKDPRQLLPVMMVDSFLRLVALNEGPGKINYTSKVKNKTIAVIGAGDGARIAVEALVQKFDPTLKILWLGQTAKTPDEYRATTWSRYFGIADEMGNRIQGGFVGHVKSGRQLTDGSVELIYGDNQKVTSDYVINATGYDNVIPALVSQLTGHVLPAKVDYRSVTGAVPEVTSDLTVIGKQIEIASIPEQDIFVIGPAGGAFASPEELLRSATENPVSVEVLGPRSKAMADFVLQNVAAPQQIRIAKVDGSLNSQRVEVPNGKARLNVDLKALENLAKIEIIESLREFKIADGTLLLQVKSTGSASQIVLSVANLSQKNSILILQKIKSQPGLLNLLQKIAKAQTSTTFRLEGL